MIIYFMLCCCSQDEYFEWNSIGLSGPILIFFLKGNLQANAEQISESVTVTPDTFTVFPDAFKIISHNLKENVDAPIVNVDSLTVNVDGLTIDFSSPNSRFLIPQQQISNSPSSQFLSLFQKIKNDDLIKNDSFPHFTVTYFNTN